MLEAIVVFGCDEVREKQYTQIILNISYQIDCLNWRCISIAILPDGCVSWC